MSISEIIKKNKENFLKFNQSKYARFQLLINPNIKKTINSIPLLLSVNDKKFPGYVPDDVPYGISGYEPDEEIKKFTAAKFRAQSIYQKKDKCFIEMFAVMGSVGTIAYNKKSDFDYWVCINKKNATEKQLEGFKKKVEDIQKWAINESGVEVHIFINDIENIKRSIFAEDDEEAFGTTTGAVLMDEFYRSSIIIAGKIPFWWIVPRQTRDSEYHQFFDSLSDEEREKNFVDLGNLYEISREDFLGAALFQLIKSLGNPFKSILKIGVLEKYLFSPDNSPLLCHKVKSNIQSDSINDSILDSYILMFEEVYSYYESAIEEKGLLKILRQNLYLKINPQLSKYAAMRDNKNLPYSVAMMFTYTRKWGWSQDDIKDLDNFENWDYTRVMQFWNMVKKFMILSYQKISGQIPNMNLANKISVSDFKLLSRKIKSHFSSEEDKIDNYITFKETANESILYIDPVNEGIKTVEWKLSKRDTSHEDRFYSTTIKTEKKFLKLLAWSAINQIFHPLYTRLKIQSGYQHINPNSVLELLGKIYDFFNSNKIKIKNDYYMRQSFNLINLIIINFNIESSDTIQTIHHIYMTSWGESYIKEYSGDSDLTLILKTILSDGLVLRREYDSYCAMITPDSIKKQYKSIGALFKDSYDYIVKNPSSKDLRFCGKLGENYISILNENKTLSLNTHPNIVSMLASISLKPKKDIIHRFHGEEPRIQAIEAAYSMRSSNSVNIVYEEMGKYVLIHVLNERGNIFSFMKPSQKKDEAIVFTAGFIKNIVPKVNATKMLPDVSDSIFIHRIFTDKFGKINFANESKNVEQLFYIKFKQNISFSATVSKNSEGENIFSLTGHQKKASQPVIINRLHDAIQSIDPESSTLRMISNITFSDLTNDEKLMGTTPYLLEKYRLEFMMERIK